jgi:hypothetical protein
MQVVSVVRIEILVSSEKVLQNFFGEKERWKKSAHLHPKQGNLCTS